MPKYRIETNQGNFEIEADREPTMEEVQAHLSGGQQPGQPANHAAQSTAAEPWKPYFNSREEFEAAKQRQATEDVESVGSKAKMAGQALGSAALKVGLPAAAVALAPVTGGASLAAIGGVSGVAGEYLGAKVAGEEASMADMTSNGVASMIPGANMAKATVGGMVREGVKQGLGNLASATTYSAFNQEGLPSGAEALMAFGGGMAAAPASRFLGGEGRSLNAQQSNMKMRDEVHRAWRAAGGKVDPASVGSSVPGVQTMAGKEGMKQVLSEENAPIITKLIREELGTPGTAPISVKDLKKIREDAGKSYEAVAKLSKQAASDLENLRQARFNAQELGQSFKTTGNPAGRQPWLDAKRVAQNLEDLIEKHATDAGKPELVEQLKKDRKRIAQSYDVQTALNPSNGQVDAHVLALGYDGENMTGNLKLVADVGNNFSDYVIEPSRIGAPGVSRLGAYNMAQGMAHGSPAGFLSAGIPMLDKPARRFLLSDTIQNWAARNPVDKLPESVRQAMVRFSTLSAGRKVAAPTPTDGFLPEGQPVAAPATPQPASGQTTYTDEHGNTYPIRDVPGMGRGVVIENKFYPVID